MGSGGSTCGKHHIFFICICLSSAYIISLWPFLETGYWDKWALSLSECCPCYVTSTGWLNLPSRRILSWKPILSLLSVFLTSHKLWEMNPTLNYQIHFAWNLQKLQNANSPLKSCLLLWIWTLQKVSTETIFTLKNVKSNDLLL